MLKTRNATRRCISEWRAGLGGSDSSRSHLFPNPSYASHVYNRCILFTEGFLFMSKKRGTSNHDAVYAYQ